MTKKTTTIWIILFGVFASWWLGLNPLKEVLFSGDGVFVAEEDELGPLLTNYSLTFPDFSIISNGVYSYNFK